MSGAGCQVSGERREVIGNREGSRKSEAGSQRPEAGSRNALRAAFDATMKDPVFLAEAKKRGMELNPTPGKVVQADVEKLIATPPAIVGKVKAMLGF